MAEPKELKPGETCTSCGTTKALPKKAESLVRVMFDGEKMDVKGNLTVSYPDPSSENVIRHVVIHGEVIELPESCAKNCIQSGMARRVGQDFAIGRPDPPETPRNKGGRRQGLNPRTLGADERNSTAR